MLVLARKVNEVIFCSIPGAGRIAVQVCSIRGDKVRLGITADPTVSIHRGEVQERIDSGEPPWPRGEDRP